MPADSRCEKRLRLCLKSCKTVKPFQATEQGLTFFGHVSGCVFELSVLLSCLGLKDVSGQLLSAEAPPKFYICNGILQYLRIRAPPRRGQNPENRERGFR